MAFFPHAHNALRGPSKRGRETAGGYFSLAERCDRWWEGGVMAQPGICTDQEKAAELNFLSAPAGYSLKENEFARSPCGHQPSMTH